MTPASSEAAYTVVESLMTELMMELATGTVAAVQEAPLSILRYTLRPCVPINTVSAFDWLSYNNCDVCIGFVRANEIFGRFRKEI